MNERIMQVYASHRSDAGNPPDRIEVDFCDGITPVAAYVLETPGRRDAGEEVERLRAELSAIRGAVAFATRDGVLHLFDDEAKARDFIGPGHWGCAGWLRGSPRVVGPIPTTTTDTD